MPRWPERKDAQKTIKRLSRERKRVGDLGDVLAARWLEARQELGLSQRELGEALGHPQSWVSDCEGGRRQPNKEELVAVARVLGKPVGWFLGQG